MAYSKRNWTSRCTLAIIGVIVVTRLFCVSSEVVLATPLRFQFDAQIVSVSLGSPFDLPFEFQVGDTISGKFEFEPGPGNPINTIAVRADQALPVELNINGSSVMTADYTIVAFNDSIDYDSERVDPYDGVILGCREASCIPDLVTLPDGEPFKVRWEMRLAGNGSVWSTPEVPRDPDVWNAFTDERRLHVGCDNLGPGSVGFDAVVSSMYQAPEPTLVSQLLLPALCAIHRRKRR